jgi:ribose-phosphate pyrophosphokinase
MSKKLLFTTSTYAYMRQSFLEAGDFEVGEIERKHFPDGERYLRLVADSWGRDVVLLGGTPTDLDALEVYDLGYAISRAGAHSLAVVMPYFGYATMERAVRPGEVVTAKTRARLISAIPSSAGSWAIAPSSSAPPTPAAPSGCRAWPPRWASSPPSSTSTATLRAGASA